MNFNQRYEEAMLKREAMVDPKVSLKRAVDSDRTMHFYAVYRSPFITMKFDWTIEDYNVDVSSGFKSPSLRMYGKTVRFFLERHRNEDDGTYYDSLGVRSDFRSYLSGSVKINDGAEIEIHVNLEEPYEVMCLVKKLPLIPKVRFLFDLQVNELLTKRCFAVKRKRVTEMNTDTCRDNFVDDVRGLWQNPQFSDVTICTPDGKTIHAHKNILSARSPVFAAMFNCPTQENVLGVVQVRDVPFDHLERVIGFLYGRMPDVEGLTKMADLCDLHFACDKYQVLDLRLLVAQTMVARMPIRMMKNMVELFERRNDKDGISIAVARCVMHYADVEREDALKDMNPKYADLIMDRIREFRY